jgi:N-formylglutamate amidohydrolase
MSRQRNSRRISDKGAAKCINIAADCFNKYSEKGSMVFVITVPHALCPPDKPTSGQREHPCDSVASRAAEELCRALYSFGLKCVVFRADIPRSLVDMNRPQGRDTPWRRSVDAFADRKDVTIEAVLDVHSFPATSFAGPRGEQFDLIIMTLGAAEPWHLDLTEHASRVSGLRCRHVVGSQVNDIMASATERGIRTVLIEFSETLSPESMKAAARGIASYLGSGL